MKVDYWLCEFIWLYALLSTKNKISIIFLVIKIIKIFLLSSQKTSEGLKINLKIELFFECVLGCAITSGKGGIKIPREIFLDGLKRIIYPQ
jgi:hypothetical protein